MSSARTYTHAPIIDASFMNFDWVWIDNESLFSDLFQTNDAVFFFSDSDIGLLLIQSGLIKVLFSIWQIVLLHWANPFRQHFWHRPWPSSGWVGNWWRWLGNHKFRFHRCWRTPTSLQELCPSPLWCPVASWNSNVSKNYGFFALWTSETYSTTSPNLYFRISSRCPEVISIINIYYLIWVYVNLEKICQQFFILFTAILFSSIIFILFKQLLYCLFMLFFFFIQIYFLII